MTEEMLTVKQWQERVLKVRERLLKRRKRVWPEGAVRTCPVCGERALAGRSDLSREVDSQGAVLVFANLHGGRCAACHTEFLEAYEQMAIEERAGTAFRGPVGGSVTSLGGDKLGTYWPKDIARALRLHPKDELLITALSPDTAVIRVIHPHEV